VDNFDKWDKQEVANDKVNTSKARVERKAYKASLREMRKVFREKVKGERRAVTPSRDRHKFKDPLQRQRYPTNVIPGDLSTESVDSMAPPGSKVYQDTWNGRWLISMGTFVKSRSWLKYGHTDSAIVLLGKMWERFQELYGLDECPVKGLKELAATLEAQTKAAPKSSWQQPDPTDEAIEE
jgi:hypothetical protein